MPIRGRVGRHRRDGGRHCQNWIDDQHVVVDLLNQISVGDGGAGGSLGGRFVNGMASDALYLAICQFEDRYFPGQQSGFLDPNGAMLKRMEALAGSKSTDATPASVADSPAPETPLDRLREKVSSGPPSFARWPAKERADIAPLITLALKHIDNMRSGATMSKGGLERLPWPVEMFGRAHIRLTDSVSDAPIVRSDGTVKFMNLRTGGSEEPELSEMKYGQPVDINANITTGKLPALLLYANGKCAYIRAFHNGNIKQLDVLKASPIAGASEHFGIAYIR